MDKKDGGENTRHKEDHKKENKFKLKISSDKKGFAFSHRHFLWQVRHKALRTLSMTKRCLVRHKALRTLSMTKRCFLFPYGLWQDKHPTAPSNNCISSG